MARPHHLLFVCTGNVCRSPLAEALARAHAARTGVEVEVRSASTLGLDGREAHPQMVKVASEVGLDLTEHASQPLTETLVEWADHVLVMEYAHLGEVQHLGGQDKVQLLGRYIDLEEIPDPMGAWFTFSYRRTRKQLEAAVQRFIDTLPYEVE